MNRIIMVLSVFLLAASAAASDWGVGVGGGKVFLPASVTKSLGHPTKVDGYTVSGQLVRFHHENYDPSWAVVAGRMSFDIAPEQIRRPRIFTVPGKGELTTLGARKYFNACGACRAGFAFFIGAAAGWGKVTPQSGYGLKPQSRILPIPELGFMLRLRANDNVNVFLGFGLNPLFVGQGMVTFRP